MTKKKKNLTFKQKAINRISRRLKTLEKKGVALKIPPTKENIKVVLRENHVKVTKTNINDVVDSFVSQAQITTREVAKEIKHKFGYRTIAEVQHLTGMELHDLIKRLYDAEDDDIADEIKEAYGY
ncbi:MAG: hypothetical protein J6S67_17375 [Methanobrevibacter sp.]|nr:hypothetical protein [Methanobrevibacter sp.]